MVNVLTNGSWVVLGHYLTVQPWVPDFDTSVDKLKSIIVWIRLPGMSYTITTNECSE